ncbi:MAG TPA: NADH-quinone oxidoreductase subunit L, partial [Chitinophaga sp.]
MFPALIPLIPFISALLLMLGWKRINRIGVTVLGCGSIGLAALVAVIITAQFAANGEQAIVQHAGNWLEAGGFKTGFDFRMDALSVVFVLVVTIVGFLIHVYASGYMHDEPDYARFFACMNLFVGAMLTLVMA